MTSHSVNGFQAAMGATGNDALAKLVKVWESTNTRRALRGSTFGLMAVSLAACGGSDNADDDGNGGNGGEPTPVTPVLSLAELVASDDLPGEYNVAVASANLGTLSLAELANVEGEAAGAENADAFFAALEAGTINVTYSVEDTLENAEGVDIEGVVNLTLTVAGETAGADTQDATITASGSGTVSFVFADEDDAVILSADTVLDGFTTLSVVDGEVDVTAADISDIDVVTVASTVIMTAEQFLGLDSVSVGGEDGAIQIALSSVEEAADVLAAAALLADVDADQIEFVIAEGGDVTDAELADLNDELDAAVAVAGAESALPEAIANLLAAEEAQADFVAVAAANEDVADVLGLPEGFGAEDLEAVDFADAETAIDDALEGAELGLDGDWGIDVTKTDAQIAADIAAERATLAEDIADAETAVADARDALVVTYDAATANRADAYLAAAEASDEADLALSDALNDLSAEEADFEDEYDANISVASNAITLDGIVIATINANGDYVYTINVDVNDDGDYVVDNEVFTAADLDAYVAAAKAAYEAGVAAEEASDAEDDALEALEAGAPGVTLSAEYVAYSAAINDLDDANEAAEAFEADLSDWEALVALDDQATDLEDGLDDAIAAIENPTTSDDPDVIEGLGIDVIGYEGEADGGDAQLVIFDGEGANFAADDEGVTDYIYFGTGYTFVELAADDELEALGSASALEIFAREEGADVVLYIEEVATAGNGTNLGGSADIVTVTLNDVSLDDLSYNDISGILSGEDILAPELIIT